MSQIIAPFYIPPKGTDPMGVTKVRPQQGMARGEIKLVVVSGGPVFLFETEVGPQEAFDKSHGKNGQCDFDLAATLNGSSEVLKESISALMTLASDNETVGYIQFKEDKK